MDYSPITRQPLRLFELADQTWFPGYLRAKVQEALTLFWTHRLPYIQPQSPAEIAARVVLSAVEELGRENASDAVVVDFCSGGGGPVPAIERLVNEWRSKEYGDGRQLYFVMSDLHPHVRAWKEAAAKSSCLGYIPTSVDAAAPSREDLERVIRHRSSTSSSASAHPPRVFRLFCLAFHHFDDALARKVLQDAMANADGFAILELQSRSVSTMIMMALFFPTVLLVMPFWAASLELWLLLFTYFLPILPFTLVFDGVISSLRTRTPDEIVQLMYGKAASFAGANAGIPKKYRRGQWTFEAGLEMHTWPVGYLNWFVGKKVEGSA
ncbi:MAG: hypothetical protein M1815_001873 [Lichina confinis]|nr:MAG: hypothetical protein M1815_001873 [Lichina confinis]